MKAFALILLSCTAFAAEEIITYGPSNVTRTLTFENTHGYNWNTNWVRVEVSGPEFERKSWEFVSTNPEIVVTRRPTVTTNDHGRWVITFPK